MKIKRRNEEKNLMNNSKEKYLLPLPTLPTTAIGFSFYFSFTSFLCSLNIFLFSIYSLTHSSYLVLFGHWNNLSRKIIKGKHHLKSKWSNVKYLTLLFSYLFTFFWGKLCGSKNSNKDKYEEEIHEFSH